MVTQQLNYSTKEFNGVLGEEDKVVRNSFIRTLDFCGREVCVPPRLIWEMYVPPRFICYTSIA